MLGENPIIAFFVSKEKDMNYMRNKEPPFALKAKGKYRKEKENKNELQKND